MKSKLLLTGLLTVILFACKKAMDKPQYLSPATYSRIESYMYNIYMPASLDSERMDIIYRLYPYPPYTTLDSATYRHSFVDSIAVKLKKYGFCNGGNTVVYNDWSQVRIVFEVWKWTLFPTTYQYRYYYSISDKVFK